MKNPILFTDFCFPMKLHLVPVSLLTILTLFTIGCGPSQFPVAGTVKLDGQPLTSGSVTFHPTSGSAEGIGNSEIDSSGNYKLMSGGKPGVLAGSYKVVVVASGPSNPADPYSIPVSMLDKKFTEVATTPLTIEVAPGTSPDKYNLEVTK